MQDNYLNLKFLDKILLFLFIFINSIYHYQSFDFLFKTQGYFSYLLLAAGTLIVLQRATKKQINYFQD